MHEHNFIAIGNVFNVFRRSFAVENTREKAHRPLTVHQLFTDWGFSR